MWGDLRMEITLLLMIAIQSMVATMDKEATNDLGKVTEGRQDTKLTTEEEETMDVQGRQFLGLEPTEREDCIDRRGNACHGCLGKEGTCNKKTYEKCKEKETHQMVIKNGHQKIKWCGAAPETCEDGLQNQDETGIDCGGVCPACADDCQDNMPVDWNSDADMMGFEGMRMFGPPPPTVIGKCGDVNCEDLAEMGMCPRIFEESTDPFGSSRMFSENFFFNIQFSECTNATGSVKDLCMQSCNNCKCKVGTQVGNGKVQGTCPNLNEVCEADGTCEGCNVDGNSGDGTAQGTCPNANELCSAQGTCQIPCSTHSDCDMLFCSNGFCRNYDVVENKMCREPQTTGFGKGIRSNWTSVSEAKQKCSEAPDCYMFWNHCGDGKEFFYCSDEGWLESSSCGTTLYTPDIDDCKYGEACKNGGTCTDKVNGYRCYCAAGWSGKDCSTATSTTP